MEEGDDYHIWLRKPQAGFGEETDEAEREEDDGTWRARASGALTCELRTGAPGERAARRWRGCTRGAEAA